jgi:hypothetical protein
MNDQPVRLKFTVPTGTERSMSGNAAASSSRTAPRSSPRERPTWNAFEGTPGSSGKKRNRDAIDYNSEVGETEGESDEVGDVFLGTFRTALSVQR